MDWQKIETAPKDGQTSILVFEPGPYSGGRISTAIWSDSRWHQDNHPFRTVKPTVWMPLPEIPRP